MKTLTQGEKQAAISAWLDGFALMDAALIVATFAAEVVPSQESPEMRMRREDAIASLPVLIRVAQQRMHPADRVLINYDFAIREPEDQTCQA